MDTFGFLLLLFYFLSWHLSQPRIRQGCVSAADRYIIKTVSTVTGQIPNRLGNTASRLHNLKPEKRELSIVAWYRELGNNSKICAELTVFLDSL